MKADVKLPPAVWNRLDTLKKPVVAAVFNVNGRIRDPVTITVIHVLANAYFNQFGTNSIEPG